MKYYPVHIHLISKDCQLYKLARVRLKPGIHYAFEYDSAIDKRDTQWLKAKISWFLEDKFNPKINPELPVGVLNLKNFWFASNFDNYLVKDLLAIYGINVINKYGAYNPVSMVWGNKFIDKFSQVQNMTHPSMYDTRILDSGLEELVETT